jgi:hypothetical protein
MTSGLTLAATVTVIIIVAFVITAFIATAIIDIVIVVAHSCCWDLIIAIVRHLLNFHQHHFCLLLHFRRAQYHLHSQNCLPFY